MLCFTQIFLLDLRDIVLVFARHRAYKERERRGGVVPVFFQRHNWVIWKDAPLLQDAGYGAELINMTFLKVYLHLTLFVYMFIADVSEDGSQRRKSSRSHLSRARERGRSVLYHLTSQFTSRNKGKLANVSYHDDMLIIRLFCLLVSLTF